MRQNLDDAIEHQVAQRVQALNETAQAQKEAIHAYKAALAFKPESDEHNDYRARSGDACFDKSVKRSTRRCYHETALGTGVFAD